MREQGCRTVAYTKNREEELREQGCRAVAEKLLRFRKEKKS